MATSGDSGAVANPNESWRNFTKRVSLTSCKLSAEDLKRLYRLINEKQIEVGANALALLVQGPNETPEAFQTRRDNVKNAFITTVRIAGFNDEVVTGHGEKFFDSPLIPEKIISIEYDTTFSPKAQLNFTPASRATVFLDFFKPSVFGRGLPSEPTPNKSNWFVTADNEAWSTSLNARLEDFFKQRATHVEWLHKSNTYDWLVMLLGLPFALWGTARIGIPISTALHLHSFIEDGLYVYVFFFSLNVFRWMFSYGRWVFAKVELESRNSPAQKHRALWAAVFIGLVIAALWDAIKFLAPLWK